MPYTIEEKKLYDQIRYSKKKEKLLLQGYEYRAKNKEKIRKRIKSWQENNKDKVIKYNKTWRQRNYKAYMLCSAKIRAKKYDLPYNLTADDLEIPINCPITLRKLTYSWEADYSRYDAPSLDRIDNSKGYIKGNVRVISDKINGCKKDLSVEEVERLLKYMKRELT